MNLAFAGLRHDHVYDLLACAPGDGVTVLGAWEPNDEARAKGVAKGLSFPYPSLDALVNDPRIDIVAVGDAYANRGAIAIRALRAGKSVVSDKPLCTRMDELDEIDRLRKAQNLPVLLMLSLRYHENARAAKAYVDSGAPGALRAASFLGQHPLNEETRPGWYYEKGMHGGIFADIAVHGVDMLRYLTGESIDRVCAARSWNAFAVNHPAFRDAGQAQFTLTNGAGVLCDISYAAPNSFGYRLPDYWRFHLWFERAFVTFSANEPPVAYEAGRTDPIPLTPRPTNRTVLTDLISPKNAYLTSESTIQTMRDTLRVQEAAT